MSSFSGTAVSYLKLEWKLHSLPCNDDDEQKEAWLCIVVTNTLHNTHCNREDGHKHWACEAHGRIQGKTMCIWKKIQHKGDLSYADHHEWSIYVSQSNMVCKLTKQSEQLSKWSLKRATGLNRLQSTDFFPVVGDTCYSDGEHM